ncbi:MAG: glycosyltransferase [Cytophagia bacterium]|nr:glycosyltransferase [Cytophagia bacterium]
MENSEWPKVTVFTLVYNTGKYVVQAIESVKSNGYPNLQHIIIDDCSTDGESVDIVEKWILENNYSCSFIKHQKNQGICKSLNEVFKLANGEYILGVSDDLLTPTRIFDHVCEFEQSSGEVALVFGDVSLINENGVVYVNSMFEAISNHFGYVPNGNVYSELLQYNFIPAVGVTMKTNLIKSEGGFDEKLLFEDWDMWLRLARKYQIKSTSKLSGYYRRYSNSVWSNKSAESYKCCLITLIKNTSDKTSKNMAASTFHEYAEYYYKMNGDRAYYYFYKALGFKWSFKVLLFLLLCVAGLKFRK